MRFCNRVREPILSTLKHVELLVQHPHLSYFNLHCNLHFHCHSNLYSILIRYISNCIPFHIPTYLAFVIPDAVQLTLQLDFQLTFQCTLQFTSQFAFKPTFQFISTYTLQVHISIRNSIFALIYYPLYVSIRHYNSKQLV